MMIRATTSSVLGLALMVALAAACGGDRDGDGRLDGSTLDARVDAPLVPVDASVDATIDAPSPEVCDVLAPPAQSGCPLGQKCTWIVVADSPEPVGTVGCVPDGTVQPAGACTRGAPGATTGFDNCVAGAICVTGTCKDICGFGGGANEACPAGQACTRYASLFANGDDEPLAGACNPRCDPLEQDCAGAGQGCYVLVSNTTSTAVCAGAGAIAHGQAIVGQAFANSCLPGHQPRRRDQTTMTFECGALCRPADVTSTTNMASEGGVAPFTCVARGAAPPADALNGESCRYWWAREPFDQPSPFTNTLGWCYRHAAFQYDSNGDMMNDLPFPRCINLTTGDVVPPIGNPPHNDAQYFWCVQLAMMFTKPGSPLAPAATAPAPRLDVLGGWR